MGITISLCLWLCLYSDYSKRENIQLNRPYQFQLFWYCVLSPQKSVYSQIILFFVLFSRSSREFSIESFVVENVFNIFFIDTTPGYIIRLFKMEFQLLDRTWNIWPKTYGSFRKLSEISFIATEYYVWTANTLRVSANTCKFHIHFSRSLAL